MITIQVPKAMWDRFREAVNGDNYCPLCDNHPRKDESGHDDLCPLKVRAAVRKEP